MLALWFFSKTALLFALKMLTREQCFYYICGPKNVCAEKWLYNSAALAGSVHSSSNGSICASRRLHLCYTHTCYYLRGRADTLENREEEKLSL